jgi:hypothetical protein
MKKGLILIFVCILIASCDGVKNDNIIPKCDYKHQLPLNKVVMKIFRFQNGTEAEFNGVIYDTLFIQKRYTTLNVKVLENSFVFSQKGPSFNSTFLVNGEFCYNDPSPNYSMYYSSKFIIHSAVDLKDRPDLDPRNEGFITNIYFKENGIYVGTDPKLFDFFRKGIVLKTVREYNDFKKETGFQFVQNVDFSRNSVIGILVSTSGCENTYFQKLTKTAKGYEFFIDDISIGYCRRAFFDLHFVLTPKIPSGDVVTFNIKSRYF